MEKITALIPTCNNETIISRCLESVKWADEIVIVDTFSADNTLAVCRHYTDKIFQQPFTGYAALKNWAISQCSHNWIIQLDSDEQLEPGLEDEIKRLLRQPAADVDAYRLPRKNHILGRWVKVGGIYPDYQTRLFRKSVGCFQDRTVHEHLSVPGNVGTLSRHILHFGMPTISKQVANLDRYTQLEAAELFKHGQRVRWHHLALRPPLIFAYRYLWQRGWSAGYRGFILAIYLAFYDFLTRVKLWEMYELDLREITQNDSYSKKQTVSVN